MDPERGGGGGRRRGVDAAFFLGSSTCEGRRTTLRDLLAEFVASLDKAVEFIFASSSSREGTVGGKVADCVFRPSVRGVSEELRVESFGACTRRDDEFPKKAKVSAVNGCRRDGRRSQPAEMMVEIETRTVEDARHDPMIASVIALESRSERPRGQDQGDV
jgi:hypothetical protein